MDEEFAANRSGLFHALSLLTDPHHNGNVAFELPDVVPEVGIGAKATLDVLAPWVLGRACRLDAPTAFAHMDPPTPWVTWAMALWNASLNQNLLHPATAPVARQIEEKVIAWLAPFFGMQGGHMTPGSTMANLTALWSARECAGVEEVVTSDNAHLSIAKAAHLLGLRYRSLPSNPMGALLPKGLPDDLSRSALVLTAGTTSAGALDPLALAGRAAWTHVDAAWAGPLRLSPHYADRLVGIEHADSVSVSAHKWLFQPKESAFVLFRDVEKAHAAISFGGAYLATPNIGLLGSHGAVAVPLLATILAWGRAGLARRVEHCMGIAEKFAAFVRAEPQLELLGEPETGIVVWRPRGSASADLLHSLLPPGSTSLATLSDKRWMRNVAANPNVDVDAFVKELKRAITRVAGQRAPSC
jgi:L-2,4-diaminobutyrate decarboxylase